jgi:hypothetical protein
VKDFRISKKRELLIRDKHTVPFGGRGVKEKTRKGVTLEGKGTKRKD